MDSAATPAEASSLHDEELWRAVLFLIDRVTALEDRLEAVTVHDLVAIRNDVRKLEAEMSADVGVKRK